MKAFLIMIVAALAATQLTACGGDDADSAANSAAE